MPPSRVHVPNREVTSALGTSLERLQGGQEKPAQGLQSQERAVMGETGTRLMTRSRLDMKGADGRQNYSARQFLVLQG